MRKALILLAAATACAIWITSTTTAAAAGKAEIGSFGFDITGMDRGTPPGNDFYEFANGAWDKATSIPSDKSNYGMFTMLEDLSSERSRQILEEQAKTSGSKIGDLYATFMDEAAIRAAGMRPLQPTLAQLKAVKNKSDWAAEIGGLLRTGVRGPFAGFVTTDDKAPTQMIFRLSQSGLGLPDRDYYLKNEPALAQKKAAYQTYLTQLLTLTGEANTAARAGAVLVFETKLAEVHWTRIESRDDDKTYNKWALADLPKRAPGFDWRRYIAAIGASGQPNVIVSQPSAFEQSAKVIDATPLDVLKDYLTLRFIDHAAPYLSDKFVEANFAFHGTVLNGTPENEPRWKRGVSLVERVIPDDLSRLYVDRFFPPEAKAKADQLVKNVIAAMDRRLAGLTWMAPETKQKARAKLAAFTPKIGYPTKWRDYSPVVIKRGDLLGSIRSAAEFEYRRNLAKLGKPVDRTEWFMTPMTVNAYANPTWNEVVFPAAILQPPFFTRTPTPR